MRSPRIAGGGDLECWSSDGVLTTSSGLSPPPGVHPEACGQVHTGSWKTSPPVNLLQSGLCQRHPGLRPVLGPTVIGTKPSVAVTCGWGGHLWWGPQESPAGDALLPSHTGRPGALRVGEVPAEQSRQPRGRMWGDSWAWLGDGKWLFRVAGWEGPQCRVIVLEPHLSRPQAGATRTPRRFVGLSYTWGSKSKRRAHSKLMKLIPDWNHHLWIIVSGLIK